MKLNEYQEASKRTMPKPKILYSEMDKSNYAMGLAGESGEVVDLIKKEVHHKHTIDVKKVKDELGDVLHYLSGLATMYGFTLEEVAMGNVEKLMRRYPDGFSSERSVNRSE
jgi:NTP pyrophosphatase (non-canonical NTP hydrolase)